MNALKSQFFPSGAFTRRVGSVFLLAARYNRGSFLKTVWICSKIWFLPSNPYFTTYPKKQIKFEHPSATKIIAPPIIIIPIVISFPISEPTCGAYCTCVPRTQQFGLTQKWSCFKCKGFECWINKCSECSDRKYLLGSNCFCLYSDSCENISMLHFTKI